MADRAGRWSVATSKVIEEDLKLAGSLADPKFPKATIEDLRRRSNPRRCAEESPISSGAFACSSKKPAPSAAEFSARYLFGRDRRRLFPGIDRLRLRVGLLTLAEAAPGSLRVAQGDFNYRLKFTRQDEMKELADAFNSMTSRFQEIRGDLDRQVCERIKQLIRSERLAGIGFLAAGVAHEINNPLSAIAMAAESLGRPRIGPGRLPNPARPRSRGSTCG